MNNAFLLSDIGPLDTGSYVPLYAQLADKISGLIRKSGEAAFGKALPSEAIFVEHFSISRPTVRQAIGQLMRLGLVVTQKGRGTFVTPQLRHEMSHGFEDEMRASNHEVELKLLDWRRMKAPAAARAALLLGEHEEVWYLKRLRYIDKVAVGVEERYLPNALGDSMTEQEAANQPMLVLLRKLTNENSARLQVEVASAKTNRELARLLGTKVGAPILAKRIIYLFNDKPLAYGSTTFLGQHYQFRFTVNLPIQEILKKEHNSL